MKEMINNYNNNNNNGENNMESVGYEMKKKSHNTKDNQLVSAIVAFLPGNNIRPESKSNNNNNNNNNNNSNNWKTFVIFSAGKVENLKKTEASDPTEYLPLSQNILPSKTKKRTLSLIHHVQS